MSDTQQKPPVLDLTTLIRSGDTIMWGQGAGEPRTLTEALVAQRAELGQLHVFMGSNYADTVQPEHADHLQLVGIGGVGGNGPLVRAGALDVLPCHISQVPWLIERNDLRPDVVLVQLSPAGPGGQHSFGLVADYLREAMARARIVIAEINDQVPFTLGDSLVDPEVLDLAIHTSRPPVFVPTRDPGPLDFAIGDQVATLVPDRATLQLGVGSVISGVADRLRDRAGLGIHSGMLGDWLVDLTEAGAITNAYKPRDTGVSVSGTVFGTRRLYDFVHENPSVGLRPLKYTHDHCVLRSLGSLFAINSAVEVDLTGQVNAETLGGRHIGTVGGQVDFVRGAIASETGRSIIALPSTAKRGEVSRIVGRLPDAVVTTPRSDADIVVTEHGIAHLRGVGLRTRALRLAEIAGPRFRDQLLWEAARLC